LSYLIDTNVLSELRRKTPEPLVISWFAGRPTSTLYISVLTLGEIRKGIGGLDQASSKKRALLDWLDNDLPQFFHGRILSIDAAVANRWGQLVANAGRPIPAIDSLLAATAVHHNLTLVTRNVKDFADVGADTLALINPWEAA
jgi:toxin FitB